MALGLVLLKLLMHTIFHKTRQYKKATEIVAYSLLNNWEYIHSSAKDTNE